MTSAFRIRKRIAALYERFVSDLSERMASTIRSQARSISEPIVNRSSSGGQDPVVDALEWEPLQRPVTIVDVTLLGDHRGHLGTVTFHRGEQYEIVAKFQCASSELAYSLVDGRPGEFDEGVPMEGVDDKGRRIRVPRVFFTRVEHTVNGSSSRILLETHLNSLERTLTAREPTTVVDWFISGPREHGSFACRRTRRVRHQSYSRERRGPADGRPDAVDILTPAPPAWTDTQNSLDYFMVPAGGDRRAAVTLVPDRRGPSWSSCMAIEYRSEWGGTPTDDIREAMCDVLGFLFGRHILHVGMTAHDDAGAVICDMAQQPWGRDVVATCNAPDRSAVPLPSKGSNGTEVLLNPLIERYLLVRGEFDLSTAFWTVWAADRMPTGFDLPLLSSALERVMNAWFKSTKTKTRGVYIPKDEFDRLLEDDLSSAAGKLRGKEYADRIERRLRGAFSMGANERYEVFFEELQLPLGDGERAAIRARNASAHGSSNGGNVEQSVRLGWAYRVLFNRVVLHLLGYQGQYVDYSVLGHPARALTAPIGYRAGG